MSKDEWEPLGPPQGDWMDIWRLPYKSKERKKKEYNWLQRLVIKIFKSEKPK